MVYDGWGVIISPRDPSQWTRTAAVCSLLSCYFLKYQILPFSVKSRCTWFHQFTDVLNCSQQPDSFSNLESRRSCVELWFQFYLWKSLRQQYLHPHMASKLWQPIQILLYTFLHLIGSVGFIFFLFICLMIFLPETPFCWTSAGESFKRGYCFLTRTNCSCGGLCLCRHNYLALPELEHT